jgi:hypothetical protein
MRNGVVIPEDICRPTLTGGERLDEVTYLGIKP